ncbi:hypothetical protein ACFL5B_03380 [Candidatus Latescibacterota bacterium]
MEKEKRRRCVRRQQEIELPVDKRKGTERREMYRRSGIDFRMQQTEVSVERRSGKNRRAEE